MLRRVRFSIAGARTQAGMNSDQICAHRGASAEFPENSRIAFDGAISAGARWIETDLVLLADGELLVFHDQQLGRTAPGTARLRTLNSTEARHLDGGSWKGSGFSDQRAMLMSDLLRWQQTTGARLIWEMKCAEEDARVAAEAVAGQLSFCEIKAFVLSSFSRSFLEHSRRLLPEAEMALIVEALPEDGLAYCVEQGLQGLHLDYQPLNQNQVSSIKAAGLCARCYTVNSAATARRLLEWGVDMVMTDQPDLLITA